MEKLKDPPLLKTMLRLSLKELLPGKSWDRIFQGGTLKNASFYDLWDKIQEISEIPHLEYHLGTTLAKYFQSHILYLILMNSPNLEAAFQKVIQYHNRINPWIIPHWEKKENQAEISIEVRSEELPLEIGSLVLFFLVEVFHQLSEKPLNPLKIELRQKAPQNFKDFERECPWPILFSGKKDRFCVSEKILSQDIFLADPLLLKNLETFLKGNYPEKSMDTWAHKTSQCIRNSIFSGISPNLSQLARQLGISRRSLQYKLQDENISFRVISEKVKSDIAKNALLKEEVSLLDLSFLLGYSDQSSFNHAFKKWTGLSPNEFRTNKVKAFTH